MNRPGPQPQQAVTQAQKPVQQPPQATTTTVTGAAPALPYFAVDCPKLGGQPLICQAENEQAAELLYHKAVKGLDARAEITVKPATELQIRDATGGEQ